MSPILVDNLVNGSRAESSTCSDPAVVPSDSAPARVKELWWLHGHPHSKRYSNPRLTNFSALVRHGAEVYRGQTAFLYPTTNDPSKAFQSMSWDQFDKVSESIAYMYAVELRKELMDANACRKQPTIGLLGRGTSIEYFCTQMALQKLGVRVLLLAESNAVSALHHLLEVCKACAVITDARNTSADTLGLRKIPMVEELPGRVNTKAAEIDSIKFQEFGDVWERHSFIIHSSGSTGMPKPVIHTNRSLMLIARMYRLFQEFEVKNWLLLFPLYHIAGISIALSGLPNGGILSFPPLSWPPSSSAIFKTFRTLAGQGHPADIIHCAPTLIENMHEHILENGGDFSLLSSLKILQPGGAALSSSIVDSLVANGVNVKTTYGSTEIGPPMRTIPHTRDNLRCYSFRNLYPDNDKFKMESLGDNVYECVVYRGFELAAELWDGKSAAEPYRTNDLFTEDPPGSGYFVLQGRKDDILVHSNGENTSANPLQLDVQTSSKVIARALALGHSKVCVGLLVEISKDYDPAAISTKQAVWKAVKSVNEKYPVHSRIMESMIYVLPRGKTLPVTPKGNVKRKEAVATYANEISSLYAAFTTPMEISPAPAQTHGSAYTSDVIRMLLSDLSGVSTDDIKNYTTLYDLGIDSKLALPLRTALSKAIGPVSLGAIFENPSIDQLQLYYDNKKGRPNSYSHPDPPSRSAIVEQIIARLSAEFTSWPSRSQDEHYQHPQGETVLLTGSTGSLGTALLSALTSRQQIAKIYCLVRGTNKLRRLRASLTSRGLSADDVLNHDKVELLNYSMADTLLGLGIDEYAMLARDVTVVVANAWKMDFNMPVDGFEHDCLRNVMSLLRLCAAGRPKRFVFMSSISTCLGLAAPLVVPEVPLAEMSGGVDVALTTGYALSKYVVERVLHAFSMSDVGREVAVPVTMLRVGQLCGDMTTGYWNEDEMWPILFVSCAVLGAIPVLDTMNVDWVPVNVAGRSITEILLQSQNSGVDGEHEGYRVHNIVNPNPINWTSLTELLQASTLAAGRAMQVISMQEWVQKLNHGAEQGITADELPALKLLGFFEGMAASAELEDEARRSVSSSSKEELARQPRVFDTRKTRDWSPALQGCDPFNGSWFEGNLHRWRESGFLS